MPLKNKIYFTFTLLGIIAQLMFFGDVRADELRPRDNAEQETVAAPEHHAMTLVSSEPWVIEGEILGTPRRVAISTSVGRCVESPMFF